MGRSFPLAIKKKDRDANPTFFTAEPTVRHLPQRASTGDEAEQNLRFRTNLKGASTGDEAETRLTIPVKNTRESFKLHAKSEMSG